jgi:conjugal transfer pilus assembly protein TraV
MNLFKTSLLLVPLALTGCAGMNSEFSCNQIGGISGCSTMGDINQMVDKGELSADDSGNVHIDSQKNSAVDKRTQKPLIVDKGQSGYLGAVPQAGEPVRYGDKIQKVWVFPYEDNKGNYYETQVAYTVLNQSHWIGQPTKAIQEIDHAWGEE